jgi:hypothetical protein
MMLDYIGGRPLGAPRPPLQGRHSGNLFALVSTRVNYRSVLYKNGGNIEIW